MSLFISRTFIFTFFQSRFSQYSLPFHRLLFVLLTHVTHLCMFKSISRSRITRYGR